MVLDSLTHVTPDGRWFESNLNASEAELLKQMDESGTERAVVVALAGHIPNDFVLEVCERHPDRLIPCASFNPAAYTTPEEARAAFRKEFSHSAYRALKLHPRLNRYDPLDPRATAVLEELVLSENRLPVWLDTLFYYRGGTLSQPVVDTIHELVGKFWPVVFVLLHGGGTWLPHVAEAIRDCPNAFLDLSFTLNRGNLGSEIRHLVHTFDRRLVLGSDFPEIRLRDAQRAFEDLALGIPDEKIANVRGSNLQKLLAVK